MICTICDNEGVLSSAGGENFYYCRTCKIEIVLTEPPKVTDDGYLDWDGLTPVDSSTPYCMGGSKLISCGCMSCITRYS